MFPKYILNADHTVYKYEDSNSISTNTKVLKTKEQKTNKANSHKHRK